MPPVDASADGGNATSSEIRIAEWKSNDEVEAADSGWDADATELPTSAILSKI